MKTKSLLLSLFAFAAICSCSKEIEPSSGTGEVLAEDTYIKVNIVAAKDATKGRCKHFQKYLHMIFSCARIIRSMLHFQEVVI